MVDPVKAFETSTKKLLAAFTDVRHRAGRVRNEAEALDALVATANAHVQEVIAAAEVLKDTQGLKPTVATELIKSFVTMIASAEELSGLDLTVPEIVTPKVVKVSMGEAVKVITPSSWQNWIEFNDNGYWVSCYNCDSEDDATKVGWWDDSGDFFCGVGCHGEMHGDSEYCHFPTGVIHDGFTGVIRAYNGATHVSFNALKISDWCNRTGQQSTSWKTVAKGLGIFGPDQYFTIQDRVRCDGCGVYFNPNETGWMLGSSNQWFCHTRCLNYFNGDVAPRVPDREMLGVQSIDWQPPGTNALIDQGINSWKEYVLQHWSADAFADGCVVNA